MVPWSMEVWYTYTFKKAVDTRYKAKAGRTTPVEHASHQCVASRDKGRSVSNHAERVAAMSLSQLRSSSLATNQSRGLEARATVRGGLETTPEYGVSVGVGLGAKRGKTPDDGERSAG